MIWSFKIFTERIRISRFQLLSSFTQNTFSRFMLKHKSRLGSLHNTSFNFKITRGKKSQAPKSTILFPVPVCLAGPLNSLNFQNKQFAALCPAQKLPCMRKESHSHFCWQLVAFLDPFFLSQSNQGRDSAYEMPMNIQYKMFKYLKTLKEKAFKALRK